VTILISTRNQNSFHAQPTRHALRTALALLVMAAPFAAAPFAAAQAPLASTPAVDVIAANSRLELPDSPGAKLSSSSSSTDAAGSSADAADASSDQTPTPTASAPKHAAHLQMTIAPGEVADPMTVQEKVVGGLKDSVSLFSALGWITSAGWEQIWNDSPNYGTNAGAFGQRLGAATLRGVSEGIFSESFFAPVFHEDPRYYIMGAGHPFFKRLVYAGTRVLITRTDGGHTTPNFSLIAGNAAGAALTVTYYPAKNTTFSEVAQTFGGSLGGSALGFVVDEFIVDALVDLHLKKKPQP
jgi:hypothetical protein